MYRVCIEDGFCATHQVTLPDGSVEALHGHDWRVSVECAATELDACGMVVDFQELQRVLRGLLSGLEHRRLNDLACFAERGPTAEAVAEWILTGVRSAGVGSAVRVEVTEAPGCRASYERPLGGA
ncbi:MAG: hypothetical protein FLDDKLPJ_00674 [Phycisphaerae bacterium]|nr:hypothetical protein [Phycisphaerae bacterium]